MSHPRIVRYCAIFIVTVGVTVLGRNISDRLPSSLVDLSDGTVIFTSTFVSGVATVVLVRYINKELRMGRFYWSGCAKEGRDVFEVMFKV